MRPAGLRVARPGAEGRRPDRGVLLLLPGEAGRGIVVAGAAAGAPARAQDDAWLLPQGERGVVTFVRPNKERSSDQ